MSLSGIRNGLHPNDLKCLSPLFSNPLNNSMIDLQALRAHSVEELPTARQFETLERLVLDLMMEVEALRSSVIKLSTLVSNPPETESALDESPAGVSGSHSIYGRAYLEAAWLTHWSAGPSSGMDKLLELFYGNKSPSQRAGRWREVAMLVRLGYTDEQIRQFIDSATTAEQST